VKFWNNATGAFPLSQGVADAVSSALNTPPAISGRDSLSLRGTKKSISLSDSLQLCRERLSRLLNTEPNNIVLLPNATYGFNLAILGLGLKSGDLVITSVMEHNSILRPLNHLKREIGIRVEYIPIQKNAQLDIEAFQRLLKGKPRLVAITHASNVTGRINPIHKMFKEAKSAGAVTLLDACQTVGKVNLPLDLCADIIVFSGYKGLRGPAGTGVLFVQPEIYLKPTFTGGTGIKSEISYQPDDMPTRLEIGTHNLPALAGLEVAVAHFMDSSAEIIAKEELLLKKLLFGLIEIPNVDVIDTNINERVPIVSFTVNNMDADTVGFALKESFGIECRSGLHCAPLFHAVLGKQRGSVRLSPSYQTHIDEIEYVLQAIRKISA